jgi:uncharacterized protein (DUF433 family)
MAGRAHVQDKRHPKAGDRDMDILGKGVYTVPEAARLTRLRPQRVREWFRGRHSDSRIFKPVFQSDYPVFHEEYAISFLDLVELYIGGKLRDAGVSLRYLRKAYNKLREDFGDHPFCRREIYFGGKKIFTRGMNEEESSFVIETITDQAYFDNIIMPFLQRIDYDDVTDQAIRWHIAKMVVIDPRHRFGKPIIEEIGIATSVLRESYYANAEDVSAVANWFGVEHGHVLAAVEFEDSLAA